MSVWHKEDYVNVMQRQYNVWWLSAWCEDASAAGQYVKREVSVVQGSQYNYVREDCMSA